MPRQTRLLSLFLFAGCLLLGGLQMRCQSNPCTPGSQGTCACPNGLRGTWQCNPEGVYSACFCPALPGELAPTPDASSQPDDTTPEATPEPRPEPQPEAGPEAQPEPTPESAPEPQPEAQPEPQPEALPEAQPEPQPEMMNCEGPACQCAQGESYCASRCVDTQLDRDHCGACDNTCPNNTAACINARCVCLFSTPIKTFSKHGGRVVAISFSPDGKMLASVDHSGGLQIWDIPGRKHQLEIKSGQYPSVALRDGRQLSFRADNKSLFLAGSARWSKIYDVSMNSELKTIYDHKSSLTGGSYSQDGTLLATSSSDKHIHIHNADTFKRLQELGPQAVNPGRLVFHPDGSLLAVILDKEVWLYNTTDWTVKKKFTDAQETIRSLRFNRDGKMLAAGTTGGSIHLWDIPAERLLRTITFSGTFAYTVHDVDFSPDDKYLVSGWGDRTAKIHEIATGTLVHSLGQHFGFVSSVRFSPDGKLIATGSGDGDIILWGCP